MTIQTNANILVAAHRETTLGIAATATGATQVRLIGSTGLTLKRGAITSAELRTDGLTSMGRLGGKSVDGGYTTELSVGGHVDLFLEALMRSTWATSTAIGFATMTTIAIGTNTLTAAGGDFVGAQGIRVGDIFTLTGTTVSGNNSLRNVVVAVGSMTIVTTTGAFTTLVASATGTLTILKKLKTSNPYIRYSHTIEQYDADIDLSELFLGCRCIGAKLSFKPNAMAMADFTFLGMDHTALATGTSPYFTSPSLTTGLSLIADDSAIRFNGSTVTTFTGFDLNFSIKAKGESVIGSFVPPDIFDNELDVTGMITGLRSDFSNLTLYDAETEFEMQILLKEPGTAPQNCIAIYLPRVKIAALAAPVGGGDGPKVVTLGLMIGPKVAATGYDGTICTISSTAP